MTDNTAPDITTGFIQMVEAFKAKPALEKRIAELEAELTNKQNEVANLANNRDGLEHALSVASQDKERLTRERDEAMFRTLELEEKVTAISDLTSKLTGIVHPEPVAKDTNEVQSGAGSKDSVTRPIEGGYETKVGEHSIFEPNRGEGQAYDGGFQGLPPSSGSNVESFPRPEYSGQGAQHPFGGYDKDGNNQGQGEGSGPASELMASSDVKDEPITERRPNEGRPYSDKPYWVSDTNWRAEGGQGPYEDGSWTAPWSDRGYGS